MGTSTPAPWLKYYGSTPASLEYPDKSMYQLLAEAAARYPRYTAYSFLGKKTTYRTFLNRIESAARGLYALGIRKGDRVTICMANTPQALDCFYALNRLGAVANMIHPLSAAMEIAAQLNMSRSKAILTLDQFYNKVSSILPQVKNPCTVIIATIQEELPFPKNLLYPLTKAGRAGKGLPKTGCHTWKEVQLLGTDLLELPADEGKASDTAAILYSGGTTGTSKGILLSNLNFNAQAMQTIAASGYDSIAGMKMLAIMPIFHGFGLGVGIHTPLIGGAGCILVPQFSVKTYSDILRRDRPNLIPGVPTLFEALLRTGHLEGVRLDFLRGIFCGGDNLSPELKKRVDIFLREHGCAEQIREGYGATECVAASCLTPKDYAREGSIGVPFPDTFFKITDREGRVLPPGSEGEICISGPTVMQGYMDNEAETALALRRHEDGRLWLHTGDCGYMDEDGFVYFLRRLKRMIISSGYNVYPTQVENILNSHKKVLQSCVIGVKDSYRGQRVKAYIVPAPGIAPTEKLKKELLDHCARHIAKFSMPREVEFRRELPKTNVGKLAYRVLEEEANNKEESR